MQFMVVKADQYWLCFCSWRG